MLEERIKELESDDPQVNEGAETAFETSALGNLDLTAFADLGGSSGSSSSGPPWFEASSSNSSPQPPFTTLRTSSSSGSVSPDRDAPALFDFGGFNSATMPYMPRWDPNEPLPLDNQRILFVKLSSP